MSRGRDGADCVYITSFDGQYSLVAEPRGAGVRVRVAPDLDYNSSAYRVLENEGKADSGHKNADSGPEAHNDGPEGIPDDVSSANTEMKVEVSEREVRVLFAGNRSPLTIRADFASGETFLPFWELSSSAIDQAEPGQTILALCSNLRLYVVYFEKDAVLCAGQGLGFEATSALGGFSYFSNFPRTLVLVCRKRVLVVQLRGERPATFCEISGDTLETRDVPETKLADSEDLEGARSEPIDCALVGPDCAVCVSADGRALLTDPGAPELRRLAEVPGNELGADERTRVSALCARGRAFGLVRPGLIPFYACSGGEVEFLAFSAESGELSRKALGFVRPGDALVDVASSGDEAEFLAEDLDGELLACKARVDGLSGEWVREERVIGTGGCGEAFSAFLWVSGVVALSCACGMRFVFPWGCEGLMWARRLLERFQAVRMDETAQSAGSGTGLMPNEWKAEKVANGERSINS